MVFTANYGFFISQQNTPELVRLLKIINSLNLFSHHNKILCCLAFVPSLTPLCEGITQGQKTTFYSHFALQHANDSTMVNRLLSRFRIDVGLMLGALSNETCGKQ